MDKKIKSVELRSDFNDGKVKIPAKTKGFGSGFINGFVFEKWGNFKEFDNDFILNCKTGLFRIEYE
jgi:hypothetical protein